MPLPLKLLLSYLLLLAIAAVPNFVYVRARLERDLVEDARHELLGVAQRTAAALAPLSPADRLSLAHDLAIMTGDRVTLVAPTGEVLFDSAVEETERLESHRDRVEVQDALAHGTGSAVRSSDTTGKETLYGAARMPLPPSIQEDRPTAAPVVRVARPLSSVRQSTANLTRFSRNIQAAAISVALLLSLLAATKFLRPLQRVIEAAKALGVGDLAARSGVSSNDEVGDAGRAIDTMALEIRRRLATAGSGDAVLSQLVDALPVPCVVFEVTGEVLALNGAARAALRVEGPNASRRLKELTASSHFERALEAAEGDGEPEPLDVEVAPGVLVRGTVHVLKRPGTAPLYVLLGSGPSKIENTTLPAFEAVRPRQLREVWEEAKLDAKGAFTRAGIELESVEAPSVLVVDIGHRVARALSEALCAGVRALEGRSTVLVVDLALEETRVKVAVKATADSDAVARIAPLLEPLGGSVLADTVTTLWIPRA
jgi:HAMP domain-containing protein